MASKIIGVRLNDDEQRMLLEICPSDRLGDMNPSELIRLLIRREHARRKTGRSAIEGKAVSTDYRTGRPRRPKKSV